MGKKHFAHDDADAAAGSRPPMGMTHSTLLQYTLLAELPVMPLASLLLAVIAALAVMPAAARALPASGSLYLAIPNNSVKCVMILLPDDTGYYSAGRVEYRLRMTPDPMDTWSDLSDRTYTFDNGTAKIGLCFSSVGKPVGNCSAPFLLNISVPKAGIQKLWLGGACASKDFDIETSAPAAGPAQPAANPMDGLDNVDIFSMALVQARKQAKPGEAANFTLRVQSQASLIIDINAAPAAGVSVTPASAVATTSPSSPYSEIQYAASPVSAAGTYLITFVATARGCGSGPQCSRRAVAELGVGDSPAQTAGNSGFSVSLFPENLNIESLSPVTYRLTVINGGATGEFSLSGQQPEGLEWTFAPTTITVPSGDYRTITFTATPQAERSSYEFRFSAVSGSGVEKPVVAYLSTNEMSTDISRNMDRINQVANTSTKTVSQADIDKWYRTSQGSQYGENLQSYSGLQADLQAARQQPGPAAVINTTGNGTDNGTLPVPGGGSKGIDIFGRDMWILLVIALAVSGGLMLMARSGMFSAGKDGRSGKKNDSGEGIPEGF